MRNRATSSSPTTNGKITFDDGYEIDFDEIERLIW